MQVQHGNGFGAYDSQMEGFCSTPTTGMSSSPATTLTNPSTGMQVCVGGGGIGVCGVGEGEVEGVGWGWGWGWKWRWG